MKTILSAGTGLLCLAAPMFAGQPAPVVPEPATIGLMGAGLGAILVARHYIKKRK